MAVDAKRKRNRRKRQKRTEDFSDSDSDSSSSSSSSAPSVASEAEPVDEDLVNAVKAAEAEAEATDGPTAAGLALPVFGDAEFMADYVQVVEQQFAEELARVRASKEFSAESVPALEQALRSGAGIFDAAERAAIREM
ncbi:uncharacterized protein V1510DRAFT_414824 [Dipodascopsis tothii]|uniref:uncharacterized protein n=1 Tax=Dipodascopsis tothii TaxID=44089 RepID=UPI0034CDD81D